MCSKEDKKLMEQAERLWNKLIDEGEDIDDRKRYLWRHGAEAYTKKYGPR